MTAHDDMVDAMAKSLAHNLLGLERSQRIANYYSFFTVAVEALWNTMWTIALLTLLMLIPVKHAGSQAYPGLVFFFAAMTLVAIACHAYLNLRARRFYGTWNGKFIPGPPPMKVYEGGPAAEFLANLGTPIKERSYTTVERSLNL